MTRAMESALSGAGLSCYEALHGHHTLTVPLTVQRYQLGALQCDLWRQPDRILREQPAIDHHPI